MTGAAGFAGSHLTERLLRSGRDVFGLVQDRHETANLGSALAEEHAASLHLVEGDLQDEAGLRDAVGQIRPDEVYHLAAQSSVRRSLSDPAATFRINVLGTQAVLEAVCQTACRPRILCVGSAEAYGESARRDRPLEETDPLRPVSPYGSSKAAAEQIARRYGWERGLHIVRVRPFPHTGPRQAPDFVYPDMAQQLCEIRSGRRAARVSVGNLEVRRDLSDVRDVVTAYVLALEQGEAGAVYNVCTGRPVSLRAVLETLIRLTGVTVEVADQATRRRPQDLEVLCGSFRALNARTGWQPRIPLETTLHDLVTYWTASGNVPGQG